MYYLIITKKDNICNTQFSKENKFVGQQGVGTKEKASHKTCFHFVAPPVGRLRRRLHLDR